MTTFSEKDAASYMSYDEKPPEFRLIRLGKYLGKNRELIPDVLGALLCADCLGDELSEYLSGSMGLLGQVSDARVVWAIENVRAACAARKIAFGVFSLTVEPASGAIKTGAMLVAVGTDLMHLANAELGTLKALQRC